MYLVLFWLYLVVSLPRACAAYTQEESNTIGQVKNIPTRGMGYLSWWLVTGLGFPAYPATRTRTHV
jgi:hypothetical protein